MIKSILQATGVPFHETLFNREPAGTYAVYMDDVDTDGPDDAVRIFHHSITVELYAPKPDQKAENAVEHELSARGIQWSKQARYWIESVQRYQTIYEFTYITKT